MSDEHFATEILKSQRPLYAYVCTLLGNSEGADDILQEVNLVLWRKMGEFDMGRDFLSWAYGIVRFQVMAHVKKIARRQRVFSEAMRERIADRAAERRPALADQMEALESCLQKLPQRQREYITLRYRQSLSVRQIGEQLAATENTVMTMLSRARLALSRCVRSVLGETR